MTVVPKHAIEEPLCEAIGTLLADVRTERRLYRLHRARYARAMRRLAIAVGQVQEDRHDLRRPRREQHVRGAPKMVGQPLGRI